MENPSPAYAEWMREHAHHHEYSELVVSLSGSHLYGVGGKAVKLSPGSAALIPVRMPHDSWYSKHHDECVDFWFHFLPHDKVTPNFLYHHPASGLFSEPLPSLAAEFQEEFHKAARLLNIFGPASERKTRHFLAYLLHEVFEFLMETDLDSQPVDERSIIEDVKLYAMEHLTDRLTLTDLAKAAGYSPFHFHRIFLEAEGITPRAFVEARRLKKACDLLKAGRSVTSAAMDSGFSTPSQFTTVFKKKFQLSPSEWMKTVK